MRRILSFLIILVACAQTLHAQIQVGVTVKRRLYMMYEPIIATVTLTNLSGRDVPLSDADGQHWFGFNISRADGMPVAPINPNYELTATTIPAGQTLKRSVNLGALYPVHEFGLYRIKATIYFAALQKFYESSAVNLEISEGKTIFQQVVGVPDGAKGAGETRKYSLLTFRQSENSVLYVRVEDPDNALIYCTVPLGRIINTGEPQIQIDVLNQLHVMHVFGPKTYLYSIVNLSGKVLSQSTYHSEVSRPVLRRDNTGEVAVVGGEIQAPNTAKADAGASSAPTDAVPKLSDHPVVLPQD